MVEIHFSLPDLMRFLKSQELLSLEPHDDMGYGLHAWLGAAFGPLAPKPWRLFMDQRRPPRILGYTQHTAAELRARLQEFGDPAVLAVCPAPEQMIHSKEMPRWQAGRRLGFQVLCCPVGRKSGTGIEKDFFLIHADNGRPGSLSREQVYCQWAKERLERNGAATVLRIRLAGFRLVRQTRRTGKAPERTLRASLTRPQALLDGEMVVHNPDSFTALLANGIGRHKAFGYGMILLRPPS